MTERPNAVKQGAPVGTESAGGLPPGNGGPDSELLILRSAEAGDGGRETGAVGGAGEGPAGSQRRRCPQNGEKSRRERLLQFDGPT